MKIEKENKFKNGIIFKGKINNKKFKASYNKNPYFIHVERTDNIKKPLKQKEREKVCKYIKQKYNIKPNKK
jgi:hypothetical protein